MTTTSPARHVPFNTPEARARFGLSLRGRVPVEAHADLGSGQRADPLRLLADQETTRVPELLPLRHERMAASPFAFYRGAATVMAADLSRTPRTGLTVQACGDAHLSNFGIFASPERRMVFDINDFDETHPGPWEWDVKRLAASLVIAARENGFTGKQSAKIARASVRRYQQAMGTFATMRNIEVWYAHLDVEDLRAQLADQIDRTTAKRMDKNLAKARARDHLRSVQKLTAVVDGKRRFAADPPVLVPLANLVGDVPERDVVTEVRALIDRYSTSLGPGRRELVRSYDFVDIARKVVGVGSVGTRCWVVLMRGRDDDDPLLLQVKEAPPSVLAAYLAPGEVRDNGARVVQGQRIMQAVSDVFLGSLGVVGLDGQPRSFYVRQLHDWKGSAQVEQLDPKNLKAYGEICGWTLARAHARSGDRIAIAAYLGEDDGFAHAISAFSEGYADLNEQDHARYAREGSTGPPG